MDSGSVQKSKDGQTMYHCCTLRLSDKPLNLCCPESTRPGGRDLWHNQLSMLAKQFKNVLELLYDGLDF